MASVAKNQSAQVISEARNVFGIGCRSESLGEFKELFLFTLLGLDPFFDQIHDDPVRAEASLLRQAAHPASGFCRKPHTLTNNFIGSSHVTIIHQNGDKRFSVRKVSVPVGSAVLASDSRFHSARRASTGFTAAARRAGR